MTAPLSRDPAALEDYEWALERVTRLCASAYVDASVYGKKLLKGFGYPNQTFQAAQDARALSIVLSALETLRAERDQLRELLDDLTNVEMINALKARAEAAEAQVETLRAERDQLREQVSIQFKKHIEYGMRTDAAEAKLATLETARDQLRGLAEEILRESTFYQHEVPAHTAVMMQKWADELALLAAKGDRP